MTDLQSRFNTLLWGMGAAMIEQGDERTGYQAPALEKGLEIIEHLSENPGAHAAVEIAKAMGRSRNEIYRMLVVLERRGYLERTSDDRYRLTNKLFDLGMRTPPLRNLHDAALPLMHRLADRLMQSCHLAVVSGIDIVVIARIESPDQLGFAVRLGYRRRLHLSTSGRVLFAFQANDRQSALLERLRPTAEPQDLERFLVDCARAKADGYFAGPSLYVDAVTDIGAPVYGGEDGVIASLTMPFVSGRSARTSMLDAMSVLRETAQEISLRMIHG
jgi:DNA-binding IclR family transcriptional regulator